MKKHNVRSEDEKTMMVRKTKALINDGVPKSIASLRATGIQWVTVEHWCVQSIERWSIMYPGVPFPHRGKGEAGPKDKSNLLSWTKALRMMREGFTIRPEESMLYRYSIENGKLVEWRRNLSTFEWSKADDVTLNRICYKQWMYEVVQ